MDLLRELNADESGFIVTMELLLIVTIVVIGMIAGLTVLRDAIVSELNDVAQAVDSMNQAHLAGPQFLPVDTAQPGSDLIGPNGFSAQTPQDPDNCVQVFGRIADF